MSRVEKILIRIILNSNGGYAVEADIVLAGGYRGRASSPVAILPGRREKHTTRSLSKAGLFMGDMQQLQGREYDQKSWDMEMERHLDEWGTDITLALSLAFARAAADMRKIELVEYIRTCGTALKEKPKFSILVPVFSAGVHNPDLGGSLQQIMMSVPCEKILETIISICDLYTFLEEAVKKTGHFLGYSSSSGFLTEGMTVEEELSFLSEGIRKKGEENRVTIALDVAAEHFFSGNGYVFYHKVMDAEALSGMIQGWALHYPISYIEDPFDASDEKQWKLLRQEIKGRALLLSDDFSATQMQFLDRDVADGVILKMKQVGTLSGTLETAGMAGKYGMKTCVSHRSHETEDTFICDLGIAIGADYLKIGGPRRGDRTEKYNQLIRILERDQ